ncbi:MAG: hypothetical protein P8J45_14710 [Phycisphaerales bacterium]|jgi:hypothetical protein|nr:hypothetical protein [Phycisphaerales bacterium]
MRGSESDRLLLGLGSQTDDQQDHTSNDDDEAGVHDERVLPTESSATSNAE